MKRHFQFLSGTDNVSDPHQPRVDGLGWDMPAVTGCLVHLTTGNVCAGARHGEGAGVPPWVRPGGGCGGEAPGLEGALLVGDSRRGPAGMEGEAGTVRGGGWNRAGGEVGKERGD